MPKIHSSAEPAVQPGESANQYLERNIYVVVSTCSLRDAVTEASEILLLLKA